MFEKVDIPIAGLIENMSVFTCSECGTAHHIFGHGGAKHESEKLGVPFLGEAPLTVTIRKSGDAGVPIAAGEGTEAQMFAEIAEKIKASITEK
jgi:ATP-binding protein involved in chromosome partitioning